MYAMNTYKPCRLLQQAIIKSTAVLSTKTLTTSNIQKHPVVTKSLTKIWKCFLFICVLSFISDTSWGLLFIRRIVKEYKVMFITQVKSIGVITVTVKFSYVETKHFPPSPYPNNEFSETACMTAMLATIMITGYPKAEIKYFRNKFLLWEASITRANLSVPNSLYIWMAEIVNHPNEDNRK